MSPSRTASAVLHHGADGRAPGRTQDDVALRKTEAGPGELGVAEVALRFGRSLGMSAQLSLGALTAD
jgi:hypothetical protein